MVRIFGAILLGAGGGSAAAPVSDVMMQAFYWDVPVDENNLNGSWWDNLSGKARELKECGISSYGLRCQARGRNKKRGRTSAFLSFCNNLPLFFNCGIYLNNSGMDYFCTNEQE